MHSHLATLGTVWAHTQGMHWGAHSGGAHFGHSLGTWTRDAHSGHDLGAHTGGIPKSSMLAGHCQDPATDLRSHTCSSNSEFAHASSLLVSAPDMHFSSACPQCTCENAAQIRSSCTRSNRAYVWSKRARPLVEPTHLIVDKRPEFISIHSDAGRIEPSRATAQPPSGALALEPRIVQKSRWGPWDRCGSIAAPCDVAASHEIAAAHGVVAAHGVAAAQRRMGVAATHRVAAACGIAAAYMMAMALGAVNGHGLAAAHGQAAAHGPVMARRDSPHPVGPPQAMDSPQPKGLPQAMDGRGPRGRRTPQGRPSLYDFVRSGGVLRSVIRRFRVDLGSIWGRCGAIRGRFGLNLGPIRGQSGVNLGSISGRSGIELVPTWGGSGVELGSTWIWGACGVDLACTWG